jgi:hypothetical protein
VKEYDNARDRNIFHFIERMIMQIPVRTSRKSYISIFYFFQMFYFWLVLSRKRYKPRSFCHFTRIIKSFGSGGEY